MNNQIHVLTADGDPLVFSARAPIPDDEILEIVHEYDRVVIEWVDREMFQSMLEDSDE